ncbi:MAG: hypothetical protein AAF922_12150 [Pseudomonadota bacterium]
MQQDLTLHSGTPVTEGMPRDVYDAASVDPQLVVIRTVMAENARPAAPRKTQEVRPARQARKSKRGTAKKITRPLLSVLARPDMPRILSGFLLVFLLVFFTGPVLFIASMAMLLALVLYFSLGPDRVRDLVLERYARLKARDPEAAARLRGRAAKASQALGNVVDRLPESWTRGLYLPDFEEPDEGSERWTSDPFERLKQQ